MKAQVDIRIVKTWLEFDELVDRVFKDGYEILHETPYQFAVLRGLEDTSKVVAIHKET